MERLTKRSQTSPMTWFIDHENGDLPLEPCELGSMQTGTILRKLGEYEDLEERGLVNRPAVWQESDFTEDQLMLLRMAFRMVETAVETMRLDNSDVHLSNELYRLEEKLALYDLVS